MEHCRAIAAGPSARRASASSTSTSSTAALSGPSKSSRHTGDSRSRSRASSSSWAPWSQRGTGASIDFTRGPSPDAARASASALARFSSRRRAGPPGPAARARRRTSAAPGRPPHPPGLARAPTHAQSSSRSAAAVRDGARRRAGRGGAARGAGGAARGAGRMSPATRRLGVAGVRFSSRAERPRRLLGRPAVGPMGDGFNVFNVNSKQPLVQQSLVNSILLVDDFLHFKNMTVQRNIELTQQVQQPQLEEQRFFFRFSSGNPPPPWPGSGSGSSRRRSRGRARRGRGRGRPSTPPGRSDR